MKVYYAHVMALYDTPQELRDVATLKRLGFTVLNPNHPNYQKAAKAKGMDAFLPLVLDCDALAFRALPDGRISSGVAMEIQWAREAGRPVIELPGSFARRYLSVTETREYLADVGER